MSDERNYVFQIHPLKPHLKQILVQKSKIIEVGENRDNLESKYIFYCYDDFLWPMDMFLLKTQGGDAADFRRTILYVHSLFYLLINQHHQIWLSSYCCHLSNYQSIILIQQLLFHTRFFDLVCFVVVFKKYYFSIINT